MQAPVNGNSHPAPVPCIWKDISGDLSWLAQAVEQQQALNDFTTSGDLDRLLEQHPSGPALLQPFLVAGAERGAAFLHSVKEHALAGKAEVAATSSAVSARLTELESRAKEQNAASIKEELDRLREQRLREVHGTSRALSEVADPEEGKSQNEVLLERYGNEAVAQMGCEKKDAAYEEVIQERTSQRENASYASAQALLKAEARPDIVVSEILAAGDRIRTVREQAGLAEQRKEEAQDALNALKQSAARQEEQRTACEALKKENLQKQAGKCAALKKALENLQQANAEYCSWYRDNEILRLQIQRLKDASDSTRQEIKAAETALKEAGSACGEWRKAAEHEAEVLEGRQTSAARAAVGHLAEAITGTCLNLRVAGDLSEKILRDKDAEVASLEHDRSLAEGEVEQLKCQLREPRQDARAKRTQLAQQKDKVSKYGAQISSCRDRLDEVRQTLTAAQAQVLSIVQLNEYGLGMKDDDIAQEAQRLSEEAYGHIQLFSGLPPPSDASNSGALSTLPSDMKGMIQQLLEEQKQALMLQFKADMEVRGKGSGAGSP